MKRQREGGFLIAKIHQMAGRIFARKLREHQIDEINPAQGRILFVLWRQDGISIKELARRTALGQSTLTSMLDRLETAGFLRREPSRTDRREILIWRTRKDLAMQDAYVRVSQEMTRLFYAGFGKPQIDRFEQNLRRIHKNLAAVEEKMG